MAENQNTDNLKSGQEGTTGNDRGMTDNRHEMDRDHGTNEPGTTGGVSGNSRDGSGAGTASMSGGMGDGGSSSQKDAAGSAGSGGLGSNAEGNNNAGGDSVKGAQPDSGDASGKDGGVAGNS